MIYTDNTRKAMKIAFDAHLNQVDKMPTFTLSVGINQFNLFFSTTSDFFS